MPHALSRLRTLGICIAAAFLVLVARLWWLQLTLWSEYASKALGNRTSVVSEPAPRGLIRDRRGLVLAENRDVWNLNVLPSELPQNEALQEKEVAFVASTLSAPNCPVSTAQVREAFGRVRGSRALRSVPLGELGQDLSFDQVAAIEEHQMDFPGIVVATSTRRHYPYGALAAQTIGYARPDARADRDTLKDLTYPPDPLDATADIARTTPDLIYAPDAIVGEEGVEKLCELDNSTTPPVPILAGRRGRTVYEVDATLVPQRLLAERPPTPGATVWATLDAQYQFVAQKALREAIRSKPGGMGAVVVMDVRTGDLLVLASEPCLDPNDWVSGITGPMWQQATASPGLPLINKAIGGRYPPGSVFKLISVCAAYEKAGVRESTTAYCTGKINVGRSHEAFRCWMSGRGGHGTVNLLEAIARSCNIFFYNCVLHFGLDGDTIAQYAREFGLGETTGLGLRGEVAGEVPAPRFSVNETGVPWQQGNTLNFVIGQDRLTVTPLQMCVVCAAIANGGEVLQPNLVKRIRWPAYLHREDTVSTLGKARSLKVAPKTLALVRQGMRMAVTDPHGTAGFLRTLKVTTAGKTGSAQHTGGERTHAWFVGYAPYESPRYAVVVFLAEGGTGGEAAVPIAARVLRAMYGEYEAGNPLFRLPAPSNPEAAAKQRRVRVAAAKAWAEGQRPAPPARPATPAN